MKKLTLKRAIAEMSSIDLRYGKANNIPAKEMSEAAKFLGRLGGKASAKKRFDGKTKEEISEIMRAVRLTSPQKKQVDRMATESLEALKKATTK